ncbi:MAG: urease accessory protein UreF [Pseudomonadales bacterium]
MSLNLFRLMQLCSSNLPVGGYSFSQGMEFAIEDGWLKDESDIRQWIEQTSAATLTHSDLPLIKRQFNCLTANDWAASRKWNDYTLAIRETRELLLADIAMGGALLRLAKGMSIEVPDYCLESNVKLSFTTVFSCVATNLQLSLEDTSCAYCWTIIENQVLAAAKLLPMGQTAAQLMLFELSKEVQKCVANALAISDENIGLSLPGLAMASAKHETQYSRLYRS